MHTHAHRARGCNGQQQTQQRMLSTRHRLSSPNNKWGARRATAQRSPPVLFVLYNHTNSSKYENCVRRPLLAIFMCATIYDKSSCPRLCQMCASERCNYFCATLVALRCSEIYRIFYARSHTLNEENMRVFSLDSCSCCTITNANLYNDFERIITKLKT